MLGCNRKHKHSRLFALSFLAIYVVLAGKVTASQELPSAVPSVQPGVPTIPMPGFSAFSSRAADISVSTPARVDSPMAVGFASGANTSEGQSARPRRARQITLEEVKQGSANRVTAPVVRLSQLAVEVAKQHRLGVQADYFPKFGATFMNLHTTDFLGQIVQIQRPLMGTVTQVPVQILNQNSTIATLTFVQPITPIFEVRQAVKIARADERIAKAKADASISKNIHDSEIEATYFKLLIAQRQLASAEWKMKNEKGRPSYASASVNLVRLSGQQADTAETRTAFETLAERVRELTASLNRTMGWPEDTELELTAPDPLVENITLQEVSDKSATGNAALVEAQETVVKARAAASISKMAYFPVIAAVSGYTFQNILPAVKSNFGYGGVMASYTLFDFGKREHAVKEAHLQLEMAETGLELTKAKLAADIKKSYFELEHSRQISQVAQKMGASAALLMNVSTNPESLEVRAARADLEAQMIEADFQHRQALYRLKALIGPER